MKEFKFETRFQVRQREDGWWEAEYELVYEDDRNFRKRQTHESSERDSAIIIAAQVMGNDTIVLCREMREAGIQ